MRYSTIQPASFGFTISVDRNNESPANRNTLNQLETALGQLKGSRRFQQQMGLLEQDRANGNKHLTLDIVLTCDNTADWETGSKEVGVSVGWANWPNPIQQTLDLNEIKNGLKEALLRMAQQVSQWQPFQGQQVIDQMRLKQ